MLKINPKKEAKKIIEFIKKTVKSAGFFGVIVPLSGGVDSATVLTLAVRALGVNNVLVARLPYKGLNTDNDADLIIKKLKIPKENVFLIDIKGIVELLWRTLESLSLKAKRSSLDFKEIASSFTTPRNDKIRFGNLMARVRMIILYDLAKANSALVCGTENKSEYLLGYYTLYGDSASDLEPIRHLYKTQVYQLADYLGVPKKIINKPPTAGLWRGQTDEAELGFSYIEADPILYYLFDKKYSEEKILKKGFGNMLVKKVISQTKANSFKAKIPYGLKNLKNIPSGYNIK